ncbi:hypothetical protein JST99_01915 [Candidatus Dependentiae bacterium]|nr:hypothetical protein [Candidatus Dependentiae bacterium]MCC7414740.1 hypothetical protein [Campylobacterota bacterium]
MHNCTQNKGMVKKYGISLGIGLLLALFLIATVTSYIHEKPVHIASMMVQDVAQLKEIFERIEKTCGILSFDYQANPINFLTIKKDGFVGSEIGSMNLAYPQQWQGPYLLDNPTMQNKEYEVVSTSKGYFIVPGRGVKLPNGKIVGVDIILDENADIVAMMSDQNKLMFDGKPLAAALVTEKTVINSPFIAALVRDDGQ